MGQTFPYDSMPGLYEKLESGGRVNAPVADMNPTERVTYGQYGIQALMLLPIFVDGKLIGYSIVDDCREGRAFAEEEVDFLALVNLMLGNYLIKIVNSEESANRERLRWIIDSSPYVCAAFDQNGRVLGVNSVAVEFFGTKDKQQYFDDFYKLSPAYQPDGTHSETLIKANIRKMLDTGRPIKIDWMLQSVTGEPRPVEVNLMPVTIGGEQVVIAHNRDLREREAMQAAMMRMQAAIDEAQAVSLAKSEFLAKMSHEIRTPLNAIIGMGSIGKRGETMEEKDTAIDKINDASTHLNGLLADILDMSKMETGELGLNEREFEFDELVRSVKAVTEMSVQGSNVNLNVDPKIPTVLYGDDRRLTQVATILASDAAKHSMSGNTVNMTARLAKSEGGLHTIKIAVTGAGTKSGAGLGLAISRSIVRMMGGDIAVDSASGSGIVTITVPLGHPNEGHVEKTAENGAADFSGKCIIHAEDREINREIITELLRETGAEIVDAGNGEEALRLFSRDPGRYALIMMDVQMPVMDGLEATRRIRALKVPNAKTIPIVALTADVFAADVEKCLDAGMNDHIGKPIDQGVLINKLKNYLM
jgi:PAS domain S-box-containing protein